MDCGKNFVAIVSSCKCAFYQTDYYTNVRSCRRACMYRASPWVTFGQFASECELPLLHEVKLPSLQHAESAHWEYYVFILARCSIVNFHVLRVFGIIQRRWRGRRCSENLLMRNYSGLRCIVLAWRNPLHFLLTNVGEPHRTTLCLCDYTAFTFENP